MTGHKPGVRSLFLSFAVRGIDDITGLTQSLPHLDPTTFYVLRSTLLPILGCSRCLELVQKRG